MELWQQGTVLGCSLLINSLPGNLLEAITYSCQYTELSEVALPYRKCDDSPHPKGLQCIVVVSECHGKNVTYTGSKTNKALHRPSSCIGHSKRIKAMQRQHQFSAGACGNEWRNVMVPNLILGGHSHTCSETQSTGHTIGAYCMKMYLS